MLTREQIESWIDDALIPRFWSDGSECHADEMGEILKGFARLVWNAAIEEAAKECEHIEDEYQETESYKWPELKSDAQTGASESAHYIRQLKEEE